MTSRSMEITATGRPVLIVSGPTGGATLIIDGHQINLGPNSFLRCGGGPSGYLHPRTWTSQVYSDLKLIAGKLWSHIDSAPHEGETWNAAVGIRG
jgi:hypothetical protein